MTSINLLPNSLRIKNPVAKLTIKFKKIVVVEIMLLVFIGVVTTGSILFLTRKVNQIKDDTEKVKSNINTLQSTEQRLVLAKDRAGGISQVLSLDSAYDEFTELQDILDSLPDGSTYTQVAASSSQLFITVLVENAKIATSLFNLIESANFSNIVVTEFRTNETGGYVLVISMTR